MGVLTTLALILLAASGFTMWGCRKPDAPPKWRSGAPLKAVAVITIAMAFLLLLLSLSLLALFLIESLSCRTCPAHSAGLVCVRQDKARERSAFGYRTILMREIFSMSSSNLNNQKRPISPMRARNCP